MNQAATILKDIKSRGFKMTRVREAIINLLLENDTPLSIVDIINLLEKRRLKPNKTTIYREIEFLKREGFLQEVEFGEGKKRYEISSSHHHHVICIKCKRIENIEMEKDLNSQERKILKKMDFKPIGHSLEFFGLCSRCQKT